MPSTFWLLNEATQDAEIYRKRMNGATLQEMADKLRWSRNKVRAAEQRHMARVRAKKKKVLTESGVESKTIDDDFQIMLPLASIFKAKSLIDGFADANGFTLSANDDGILIKNVSSIDEEIIQEIANIAAKAAGTRTNIPGRRRMVQQNSPQMGYPKTGGLTAISNKYNCMVSGEKRMKPCSGCGNPKGCLSETMQFKRNKKNGK